MEFILWRKSQSHFHSQPLVVAWYLELNFLLEEQGAEPSEPKVSSFQLGPEHALFPLADVFTENPDEKSIITYVVAFYHYFSKMKVLAVEGKRVGKVQS